MTTLAPPVEPPPRAGLLPDAARIRAALRSRTVWFVLERYVSTGFGFALTATLTHVAPLEQLAEYLAAYALTSTFEPMFGAAINGYLLRLLRAARTEAEAAKVFRSTFWVMQIAAIVFVAGVFLTQGLRPGEHLLSSLFFLQIAFTPWKLFSAPLIAKDRFLQVTPVQVRANLIAGVLRVAAAIFSRNLLLLPILLCLEPILTAPVLKRRSGMTLLAWPLLSKATVIDVCRQLPVLMSAMGLVCLFYRSPVMLARLDLKAMDVVHVALAMQIITALAVIQNALADSLMGPLAMSINDDGRFKEMLSIGSLVAFAYGLCVWGGGAVFGEWGLTLLFGQRAAGVGPILTALAPLCLLGGLLRLATTVVNLRGRPAMLLAIWCVALSGQALLALALKTWRSPLAIAVETPISLAAGLLALLCFPQTRSLLQAVFFGAGHMVASPVRWREAVLIMLSPKLSHPEPSQSAPQVSQ
ncbi:MAG TPA: hypothetical protein VF459_20475 [Caulobacteraceae bacterium]